MINISTAVGALWKSGGLMRILLELETKNPKYMHLKLNS
jgi:hypothetical protein